MSFIHRESACSLHHGNESVCYFGSSIPHVASASHSPYRHPNGGPAASNLSQQELFEPPLGSGHSVTEKANVMSHSLIVKTYMHLFIIAVKSIHHWNVYIIYNNLGIVPMLLFNYPSPCHVCLLRVLYVDCICTLPHIHKLRIEM